MGKAASAHDQGPAKWQVQIAFYLSLAVAAFNLWQWRYSQTESITAASIEITKNYLNDTEILKGRLLAINLYRGAQKQLMDTDGSVWNKFATNIAYVADLIDKKRINPDYLSTVVICDIWLFRVVSVSHLNAPTGPPKTGIERIAPTLESRCKGTFPK